MNTDKNTTTRTTVNNDKQQDKDKDKMEKAIEAIMKSRRMVVFTGAGMSKDSGIDTFRGSNGDSSGEF